MFITRFVHVELSLATRHGDEKVRQEARSGRYCADLSS
jgi:hypothetical protein